ncbi:hypothetical protein HAPAU_23480 [Halalkalicoccus paucihalophilus]|uniref:Uncharacterized protein n=1 Tax=Halalkalicoccus paucihalophilus TaxID=1008153 RepID=A0A151ADK1_9EURY|nr:hypothetical protein HAPAU_23480 [Halalkalicoccus paucihalophilus]
MSTDDADGSVQGPVPPARVTDASVVDRPEDALKGVSIAATNARLLNAYLDPDGLVVKDCYTWEHVKRKYYYEADGSVPLDSTGDPVPFDPSELLGFSPCERRRPFARARRPRARFRLSLRNEPST